MLENTKLAAIPGPPRWAPGEAHLIPRHGGAINSKSRRRSEGSVGRNKPKGQKGSRKRSRERRIEEGEDPLRSRHESSRSEAVRVNCTCICIVIWCTGERERERESEATDGGREKGHDVTASHLALMATLTAQHLDQRSPLTRDVSGSGWFRFCIFGYYPNFKVTTPILIIFLTF